MLAILAVVIVAGLFPRTVRSAPREPVLRAEVMSFPALAGVTKPQKPDPTPTPASTPVAPASAAGPGTPTPGPDGLAVVDATPTDDTDEGEAERVEQQQPIFFRYQIQEGDTLSGIAQRFGIGTQYILWNNIDILTNANLLRPGQTLQVPSVEGIIHDVRLHETLIEIAVLYDADVNDIVAFAANNLPNANTVPEGSTILVPGGRVVAQPPPPPPPQPTPPPTPQPGAVATPTPTVTASTFGFIWPGPGRITSWFGPAHPLGIDIGMPVGTPIAASAAGQVTFVGGHPCCSYGYYVIIRHDQSFTTRYGHFSRFAVTLGEWVEQGDLIGYSGSTGASTGPHLHFEIRRNGTPQNPLNFLP